jgi:hypothetical protein
MIQSYITAKPVLGYDPSGYVPFVAPPESYFVTTHKLDRVYDEVTFFAFTPVKNTNIDSFLQALQLELDTNYAATSFTDVSRDYLIDYQVVKIERTYIAPSTSIWEQRQYVWKVSINVRVNTDA